MNHPQSLGAAWGAEKVRPQASLVILTEFLSWKPSFPGRLLELDQFAGYPTGTNHSGHIDHMKVLHQLRRGPAMDPSEFTKENHSGEDSGQGISQLPWDIYFPKLQMGRLSHSHAYQISDLVYI